MTYTFTPQGVCSRQIILEMENGVIRDCRVEGGCSGNLQGLSRLVRNRPAQEVIDLLEGIQCGAKATSCPDQLARALKGILEQEA